jgi:hypothetical protein
MSVMSANVGFLSPACRRSARRGGEWNQNTNGFKRKVMDKLATSLWLPLRAIGSADVRYGILPSQSGSVRNEAANGPGMTTEGAAVFGYPAIYMATKQ